METAAEAATVPSIVFTDANIDITALLGKRNRTEPEQEQPAKVQKKRVKTVQVVEEHTKETLDAIEKEKEKQKKRADRFGVETKEPSNFMYLQLGERRKRKRYVNPLAEESVSKGNFQCFICVTIFIHRF